MIKMIALASLLAVVPMNTKSDPTVARCSLNAGPETECVVDFSVEGSIGSVDFDIPAGKLSFRGELERRDKLVVKVLALETSAYPADSGECNVSPGHVLCTAKAGSVSAVLEAKR